MRSEACARPSFAHEPFDYCASCSCSEPELGSPACVQIVYVPKTFCYFQIG
jgi:hypothetical protein